MKIDTSSYYPKSPLDDDPGEGMHHENAASRETPQEDSMQCQAEVIVEESCPALHQTNQAHESDESQPELPPSEWERVVTGISTFLSWVLVPLLMPVYGILLAFGLSILNYIGAGTKVAFVFIVFGFNVVAPGIVVWLLKKAGIVHDVGLNDREERFIPYVVCIVCLVGTALFLHFKGAPLWLVMFFFGGAATGLCEVVINRWWKISVHCAGVAGIIALLVRIHMADFCMPATFTWLLISIGLAGLLGASRIWLGRHTLMQVLAGYAVGFCGVYFLM